jgi:hypothetical protein
LVADDDAGDTEPNDVFADADTLAGTALSGVAVEAPATAVVNARVARRVKAVTITDGSVLLFIWAVPFTSFRSTICGYFALSCNEGNRPRVFTTPIGGGHFYPLSLVKTNPDIARQDGGCECTMD